MLGYLWYPVPWDPLRLVWIAGPLARYRLPRCDCPADYTVACPLSFFEQDGSCYPDVAVYDGPCAEYSFKSSPQRQQRRGEFGAFPSLLRHARGQISASS